MADALADGTYVVLNSANTALAIDSKGATDGNGSTVQLWTRNGTDAQFLTVFTRGDGSRQLLFPCTGKAIGVPGGKAYQGANVWQWTDLDNGAQKWTIEPLDGETATVDGTSYQLYKIYLTESGTSFLLEYNGVGTPASGGSLCVAGDEGTSADQKWAFVPANPVPTGTYVIRPRVNMSCALDVQGSSHAVGARVIISGEHLGSGTDHGNNQVVWLRQYDDNGRAKLAFCHTMMLCEIFDTNEANSGAAVCQCDDYGGTDQQWVVTPHGHATLNGTSVPCYQLRNYAAQGTSLVMDVCGGGSTPGTYVQIWPMHGGSNQDFVFQPAEMVGDDIPTPSIVGVAKAASKVRAADLGTTKTANDAGASTTSWALGWRGDGTQWQARYRYREQAPGGDFGGWSDWLSAADGSKANSGWGTTWTPNVTTKDTPVKMPGTALSLPAVNNTDRDRVEVQLEVRRFVEGYQGRAGLMAHGQSDVQTARLVWEPTITISGAELGPDGLSVSYSSDYAHSANMVEVEEVTGADGRSLLATNAASLRSTSMPAEGTVTIPYSDLADLPADGEELSVTLSLSTREDVTAEATATVAETVADGRTATIEPTLTTTDRYTVEVSEPAHDEDEAHLVQGGRSDEVALSAEDGKMVGEAVPALGSSAKALLVARESDGTWNATTAAVSGIDDGAYVWNWTDADGTRRAAVLRYGLDEPITQQDSWKAEASELMTMGRPLPAYRFAKAATRDLGVSGELLKAGVAQRRWETEADFVALLRAQHALFRNRFGGVHHVAITGVDITRTWDEYTSVSVSQNEETL